jgi:hypothetical protein
MKIKMKSTGAKPGHVFRTLEISFTYDQGIRDNNKFSITQINLLKRQDSDVCRNSIVRSKSLWIRVAV